MRTKEWVLTWKTRFVCTDQQVGMMDRSWFSRAVVGPGSGWGDRAQSSKSKEEIPDPAPEEPQTEACTEAETEKQAEALSWKVTLICRTRVHARCKFEYPHPVPAVILEIHCFALVCLLLYGTREALMHV